MDFLDPKKRRAHTIRLFVGYFLVGIALLIGTAILALAAYGFGINRKTGQVIQNGLVFIDAHPEAADIFLNGASRGKTKTRLVIPEGSYNVELRRTGYRTWKNSFDLGGGSIVQLIYPFLFPEKLVSKDLQTYSSLPGLSTESPDRHWLLVQSPSSLTIFQQFDLNATKNDVTSFSLPSNLLTTSTGPQALELVEWSTDNRHLIVRHIYPGGQEYILIDRASPSSSQNLTKLFDRPNVQFSLHDKKYDQYYLYDLAAQNLFTGDLKSHQVTLILDKVISFKPHSADVILYVTAAATPTKVQVKLKSGQNSYNLVQLPSANKYLIDVARFNNDWYMVAGSPSDGRTYIYKNPADQFKSKTITHASAFAVLKLDGPQFASFSENTRFIEVQAGQQFAVYDLENQKMMHYNSQLTLPANYKAVWMDGHRLILNSVSKMVVMDFDGTNQQTLVDLSSVNYLTFFDRDYKAVFTISPSKSGASKPALIRTELKVLPAK
ncbi:MAG TPA: PEGA domain-containing protein [Candidatus Saccharimonadales bacterium]|nr:PEGA domain-containing protein [Candidatus Saccharimonadales bacterium]